MPFYPVAYLPILLIMINSTKITRLANYSKQVGLKIKQKNRNNSLNKSKLVQVNRYFLADEYINSSFKLKKQVVI